MMPLPDRSGLRIGGVTLSAVRPPRKNTGDTPTPELAGGSNWMACVTPVTCRFVTVQTWVLGFAVPR